jgi:hypothetical protein
MKKLFLCAFTLLFVAAVSYADTTIEKPPDLGLYWFPLSDGGTYVYSDSFIAPFGDTNVAILGTWLSPLRGTPEGSIGNTLGSGFVTNGGGNSIVRYQVWGTGGNGGPDYTQVLASTDPFSANLAGLNLYNQPVTSGGGPLVPGQKYWFVATCVGLGDPFLTAYQTGGHTQNSVYPDNGTFWYSNDSAGQSFDGQALTPEMAFRVVLGGPISVDETSWGGIKGLYR